jgi:hypothetical protein
VVRVVSREGVRPLAHDTRRDGRERKEVTAETRTAFVVGDATADEVAGVLDALRDGPESVVVISTDLPRDHPDDTPTAHGRDRALTSDPQKSARRGRTALATRPEWRDARSVISMIPATEIVAVSDVLERYQLPGPHATVVMPVPKPGEPSGDLRDRWHAIRTNLEHDGATPAILEHLDALSAEVRADTRTVLLTASDESGAWCALGCHVPMSQWHTGRIPWLLPVIGSLGTHQPVIGAIVDRVGADLLVLSRRGSDPAGGVVGDEEFVHKTTRGGWSQARHQRHSEVVWDRNAELVAASIADLGARTPATLAMITGDERAEHLVAAHLDRNHRIEVRVAECGGRHEPGTTPRLHDAAMEWLDERHLTRVHTRVGRLEEELGQQDRAIDGVLLTLDALSERRVATLFLDAGTTSYPMHDIAARDALVQGADVVLAPDLGCRGGMGALLRYPVG